MITTLGMVLVPGVVVRKRGTDRAHQFKAAAEVVVAGPAISTAVPVPMVSVSLVADAWMMTPRYFDIR